MAQKTFQVSPEFKERATEILGTKKFSAVYPYMNLINREGFIYTEEELNTLVQLFSEFSYGEVAEFFTSIKQTVKEISSETPQQTTSEPVSSEN